MQNAALTSKVPPRENTPDATLHAIRSVLTDVEPTVPVPAKKVADVATPVITDVSPAKAAPAKPAISKPALPFQVPSRDAIARKVTQFRPRSVHVVMLAVLLLLVLRPQWVVLGVFLSAFLTLGAFACLGTDRVWGFVGNRFKSFARRHPERASRIGSKLDSVALRWDAFLDRFPDGSVDGPYLPDFQAQNCREEAHDAAVDARLARMQAEG